MFSILSIFACFMGKGPEAEEVAAAEEAARAALAAAEGAAAEGAGAEGAGAEGAGAEGAPAEGAGADGAAPAEGGGAAILCDPEKTRMHEFKVSKASEIKFSKDSTFSNDGAYEVWAVADDENVIGKIKMTVQNGLIVSGESSAGGFIFCAYNDDFGYDGFPVENFCVKPSAFQATGFRIEVTADFSDYTLAVCRVKVEG
jgi:hypothetical protein